MSQSFLEETLKDLGITPEQNRCTVPDGVSEVEELYFSETADGDIRILYLDLTGGYQHYDPPGGGFQKRYFRNRLNPSRVKDDRKYFQPSGSGTHIYFPPGMIAGYKAAAPIESTLFVVEGEKKAWAGDQHGLDIVGIAGKDSFHDAGKKSFHDDIRKIIATRKPKNICLILDADALEVDFERLGDDNYDTAARLNLFYLTVKKFRDAAKGLVNDSYFTFINPKLNSKGLDDLYHDWKAQEEKITTDLLQLASADSEFFNTFNISSETILKLKRLFLLNLDQRRTPAELYRYYENEIGTQQFIFQREKYQYNEETELLDKIERELEPGALDDKDKANLNRTLRHLEATESYLRNKYDMRNNTIRTEIEFSLKGKNEFKPATPEKLMYEFMKNKIPCSTNKILILIKSEFIPEFNPVASYFDSLRGKWSAGDDDYIDKLASLVETDDPDRWKKNFRLNLIRSVKCAIDENYYNKHCIVFVGSHHYRKSGFQFYLCPPELKAYQTTAMRFDSEGQGIVCKNWQIILEEMAGLAKVEMDIVKSLMSLPRANVRLPWERQIYSGTRIATFYGNTNQVRFLTDLTGNVRFICFNILKPIQWEEFTKIDINMVYAQAVTLLETGAQYDLNDNEIGENEDANKKYQQVNIEMELLQQNYVPANAGEKINNRDPEFYSASDFIIGLSEKYKHVKLNNVMVGRALNKLRFKPVTYKGKLGYWTHFNETLASAEVEHSELNGKQIPAPITDEQRKLFEKMQPKSKPDELTPW